MAPCCHLIFVVRRGNTLQESHENMEKHKIQMKVCQWVERCQNGSTTIVEDCSYSLTTSQMADSVVGVNGVVQQETKSLLAVHLHTPSSMMTLTITEFLWGGCQSSLQMSANSHTWKCPYRSLSDIVKKGRSNCNVLSYAMKQVGTFLNLQINITAWSGNMCHHPWPRI